MGFYWNFRRIVLLKWFGEDQGYWSSHSQQVFLILQLHYILYNTHHFATNETTSLSHEAHICIQRYSCCVFKLKFMITLRCSTNSKMHSKIKPKFWMVLFDTISLQWMYVTQTHIFVHREAQPGPLEHLKVDLSIPFIVS
jgi:hypothetical protein